MKYLVLNLIFFFAFQLSFTSAFAIPTDTQVTPTTQTAQTSQTTQTAQTSQTTQTAQTSQTTQTAQTSQTTQATQAGRILQGALSQLQIFKNYLFRESNRSCSTSPITLAEEPDPLEQMKYAIAMGKRQIVLKLLKELRLPIDSPEFMRFKGMTLLHWAVISGNVDSVWLLIELGANVNIKDEFGISPADDVNLMIDNSVRRDVIAFLIASAGGMPPIRSRL